MNVLLLQAFEERGHEASRSVKAFLTLKGTSVFGFSFTWAQMWASGAEIVRQERHHLRSSKFVFWHDVERGVAVGVVVAFFLLVEVLGVGPSRVVLGLVVASATSSLFAACAAARLFLGFHFLWMIILIIRRCVCLELLLRIRHRPRS